MRQQLAVLAAGSVLAGMLAARKEILQLASSPHRCSKLFTQLAASLEDLKNLQDKYEAELIRAQHAEQGLQETCAELAQAQSLLAIKDAFIITLQAAHAQLEQEKQAEIIAMKAAHIKANKKADGRIVKLRYKCKEVWSELQEAEDARDMDEAQIKVLLTELGGADTQIACLQEKLACTEVAASTAEEHWANAQAQLLACREDLAAEVTKSAHLTEDKAALLLALDASRQELQAEKEARTAAQAMGLRQAYELSQAQREIATLHDKLRTAEMAASQGKTHLAESLDLMFSYRESQQAWRQESQRLASNYAHLAKYSNALECHHVQNACTQATAKGGKLYLKLQAADDDIKQLQRELHIRDGFFSQTTGSRFTKGAKKRLVFPSCGDVAVPRARASDDDCGQRDTSAHSSLDDGLLQLHSVEFNSSLLSSDDGANDTSSASSLRSTGYHQDLETSRIESQNAAAGSLARTCLAFALNSVGYNSVTNDRLAAAAAALKESMAQHSSLTPLAEADLTNAVFEFAAQYANEDEAEAAASRMTDMLATCSDSADWWSSRDMLMSAVVCACGGPAYYPSAMQCCIVALQELMQRLQLSGTPAELISQVLLPKVYEACKQLGEVLLPELEAVF